MADPLRKRPQAGPDLPPAVRVDAAQRHCRDPESPTGARSLTLFLLLMYAVLTLWIEQRWAWALFQVGVFVLGSVRILRKKAWHPPAAFAALACAAAWPLLQLALGA